MKTIIALLTLLPALSAAEKIETKGLIKFGPEAMYFVKCGSEEKWWLGDYTFKAKGWEAISKKLDSQPLCDLSTMPCKHQRATVQGIASVSKEGQYGHLGKYSRQIYFTKLSLLPGDSCDL